MFVMLLNNMHKTQLSHNGYSLTKARLKPKELAQIVTDLTVTPDISTFAGEYGRLQSFTPVVKQNRTPIMFNFCVQWGPLGFEI